MTTSVEENNTKCNYCMFRTRTLVQKSGIINITEIKGILPKQKGRTECQQNVNATCPAGKCMLRSYAMCRH